MPRAALFDMDGTLVRENTARLWVRYERERGEATLADRLRVAWWLAQYSLGVIDAPRVAEKAVRKFAGQREADLAERCRDWYARYVRAHVTEAAREAVRRHRADGDVLVIVTGSSPYASRPLADDLGIDHVVATELEVRDGVLTGRVLAPMCYGAGKIERARALASRAGFAIEEASFYTDSVTDLPLLEAVGRPVAVNPDPRLRRVAARRRWPVERWA